MGNKQSEARDKHSFNTEEIDNMKKVLLYTLGYLDTFFATITTSDMESGPQAYYRVPCAAKQLDSAFKDALSGSIPNYNQNYNLAASMARMLIVKLKLISPFTCSQDTLKMDAAELHQFIKALCTPDNYILVREIFLHLNRIYTANNNMLGNMSIIFAGTLFPWANVHNCGDYAALVRALTQNPPPP